MPIICWLKLKTLFGKRISTHKNKKDKLIINKVDMKVKISLIRFFKLVKVDMNFNPSITFYLIQPIIMVSDWDIYFWNSLFKFYDVAPPIKNATCDTIKVKFQYLNAEISWFKQKILFGERIDQTSFNRRRIKQSDYQQNRYRSRDPPVARIFKIDEADITLIQALPFI